MESTNKKKYIEREKMRLMFKAWKILIIGQVNEEFEKVIEKKHPELNNSNQNEEPRESHGS